MFPGPLYRNKQARDYHGIVWLHMQPDFKDFAPGIEDRITSAFNEHNSPSIVRFYKHTQSV